MNNDKNSHIDVILFNFKDYPTPSNIQSGDKVLFDCIRDETEFKATNIGIIQRKLVTSNSASQNNENQKKNKIIDLT